MNVNNSLLCSFTLFYHWLVWEKLQVEYLRNTPQFKSTGKQKFFFWLEEIFIRPLIKSENTITIVPPIML